MPLLTLPTQRLRDVWGGEEDLKVKVSLQAKRTSTRGAVLAMG